MLFFFIVCAVICLACIVFLMLTRHELDDQDEDDNSFSEYDWRRFKNHN